MQSSDLPPPPVSDLARAIIETLAYADVFDYPLTVEQIRRYLVGIVAEPAQVQAALETDPWLASRIERHGDLVTLRDRSSAVMLRLERTAYAEQLWPAARRLAGLVAHLPFVRMVAIIGALSMDNVCSPKDDIDLFVVTVPGRVWLTRALIIGLVRLSALQGLELCPNFIVSYRHLAMPPDDLFTAHELAQMVPLYGRRTFAALLAANRWLEAYLPNAAPQDGRLRDLGLLGRTAQRTAEWLLSGKLGDRLERRLQARKIVSLRRQAAALGSQEAVLDAEMCKGHMKSHGGQIRAEYERRRQQLLQAAPLGDLPADGGKQP